MLFNFGRAILNLDNVESIRVVHNIVLPSMQDESGFLVALTLSGKEYMIPFNSESELKEIIEDLRVSLSDVFLINSNVDGILTSIWGR